MTSTPNTPPSTSRPSRVKKKKKKHKSEDSTNNDLTQPLLDQQDQQAQQAQQQEQDAIHSVVDVLKQDNIITTPPITNTNTTPPITNTPKILPPPQPRSISSTSSLSRGISSHTIHRQFSHISSISNVTKTDPPPTLTILHDNPNITSNITELFTTSYGCLSFVIFIMSVMTYEVLQYRCVLPYAPFTVYTLIELLWLIFGLLLLATFLIHSNTFRITVQSSPILSLIILVYSLTFMCIPILGWMLFTGVLAPHSQQTIIHRTNTMRLTYRVPACTDLDPPEAHLAALIVNIIHSVALCMSCMWCCSPTNNNKEGTYIVHRSAPPQPPHQEYNAPLLPPPALPRQTTEVKIPGSTTQPKSVLIPISDTDEIDPETPLLQHPDTPTTHRPSITRVTHEPPDMVAIVV